MEREKWKWKKPFTIPQQFSVIWGKKNRNLLLLIIFLFYSGSGNVQFYSRDLDSFFRGLFIMDILGVYNFFFRWDVMVYFIFLYNMYDYTLMGKFIASTVATWLSFQWVEYMRGFGLLIFFKLVLSFKTPKEMFLIYDIGSKKDFKLLSITV